MSPVWAIITFSGATPSSVKISHLVEAGAARRPRVGHDRRTGPFARARGCAMDLLDVGGDPGLVGGGLDERRLDLSLDPTSMSWTNASAR